MSFLKTLLLSLALLLAFGISSPSEAETIIVNKAFNGREIKVRVGGLLRVDLEELGAAGYAWAPKDFDKDHFEIVSVKTEGAPSPNDVTGAPVVKSFLIRSIKAGRSELKFLYYRPWEGEENTVDRFLLKVLIL